MLDDTKLDDCSVLSPAAERSARSCTKQWLVAATLLILLAALTTGCGKPCKDLGIHAVRPDGNDAHRVRPERHFENLFEVTWSARGSRILFEDGCSWWAMNPDGSDLAQGSRPGLSAAKTRLAWIAGWAIYKVTDLGDEFVRFTRHRPPRATSWTEHGVPYRSVPKEVGGFTIHARGRAAHDVLYDGRPGPASGCGRLITPEQGMSPRLSPDGDAVAYSDEVKGAAPSDSNLEIYKVSAHGGSPRQLTRDPLRDIAPAWSPDGRKLAYVRESRDYEQQSVWIMNADGTGQRLISARADGIAWSPDGRELVISSGDKGGGWQLYVVTLDGTVRRRLTGGSGLSRFGLGLSWAPGSSVLYVQDSGDPTQDKCVD